MEFRSVCNVLLFCTLKDFFMRFQIANGLAHCHSHRLLHLDVKPSNVLVSEDLSMCKLTDFGCSRVADLLPNGVLVAPDSLSTSSFGTIAYKAPELLKVRMASFFPCSDFV